MEELLSDWESFAQTLLPAGKTLNQAALRDDSENLLRSIALDMETAQGLTEQALNQGWASLPGGAAPTQACP